VALDPKKLKRYAVNYTTLDTPRHVYRYVRASGETTVYSCGKQDLHHVYPEDAQPISEAGSHLDVEEDDGSKRFESLYQKALEAPVKEKVGVRKRGKAPARAKRKR
jgi:hypothetical protein